MPYLKRSRNFQILGLASLHSPTYLPTYLPPSLPPSSPTWVCNRLIILSSNFSFPHASIKILGLASPHSPPSLPLSLPPTSPTWECNRLIILSSNFSFPHASIKILGLASPIGVPFFVTGSATRKGWLQILRWSIWGLVCRI